jgi:hypothetical protein
MMGSTNYQLHPTYQGYLGQFELEANENSMISKSQLVVILDVSGSMDNCVARLSENILPDLFSALGYTESDQVVWITFTTESKMTIMSLQELRRWKVPYQGGTNMAGALPLLASALQESQEPSFRILTISDGDISDQTKTQTEAAAVAELVKGMNITIEAHAVRFMTMYGGNPDTRALSSVLQLNTNGNVELAAVQYTMTDEEIVESLLKIFVEHDAAAISVNVKGANVKRNPWETMERTSLRVGQGTNFFWFDKVPEHIEVNGTPVQFSVSSEALLPDRYLGLVQKPLNAYIQRAKILKVINTTESLREIRQMMHYFESLEKYWFELEFASKNADNQSNLNGLQQRAFKLKEFIKRNKKSIGQKFAEIMNDDLVNKLNSAQQAEYLRTLDTGKNARSVAKRGAKLDVEFDFDSIVHGEVLEMHSHLDELNDVDDSTHLVSFVSQETTLGGIKAVCSLVDENILNDCSAVQILELFNIVGVPCSATVGDYPDPMTYRITKMHYDCHVSLADVLVSQSQQYTLVTPGSQEEITNVVPVMEDPRIYKFLRKYAPKMLEYLASLGMRRLLVDIPMTFGYTFIAGAWRAVEEIVKDPATVKVKSLIYFIDQLQTVVGKYFSHIDDIMAKENTDLELAYNLGNNGITNMIPYLVKHSGNLKNKDRILRALYTFEAWQMIRKKYRGENQAANLKEMKRKILGIDFNRWKPALQPDFVPEPEHVLKDVHHFSVNQEYVKELMKECWFVDYVTLLPIFFSVASDPSLTLEEKVTKLKATPQFTREFVAKELGIAEKDLEQFQLAVCLQALVFTVKKSRFDEETMKSILFDPSVPSRVDEMVKDVVKELYLDVYEQDVNEKTERENQMLLAEFKKRVISCTMDEFVSLLQNGVSKTYRTLVISNPSDFGFQDMLQVLQESKDPIQMHALKLEVILTGTFNEEPVWNNGNRLRTIPITVWKDIFAKNGFAATWEAVLEKMKSQGHFYTHTNRHGHDNGKPSYWAMGFESMSQFRNTVSEAEWNEYLNIHPDCCGNQGGVYIGDQ